MALKIFSNSDELARAAAEYFVAQSVEAVAQRGSFSVALSGGSTPKTLYKLLADPNESFRSEVPWSKIHFFWSDERHVPPDHPESNYRMANEAMLARVPVSQANVHRVASENPSAEDAARAYEENLLDLHGDACRGGTPWPSPAQDCPEPGRPRSAAPTKILPRLDLILLGLGTDGHTASIFPGSEVLHETERLVAAPWVDKLKAFRITMTLPLLNNAASILFVVSGAEKAAIVREVLEGPSNRYPAQAVKPANGELLWMLDKHAASFRPQKSTKKIPEA